MNTSCVGLEGLDGLFGLFGLLGFNGFSLVGEKLSDGSGVYEGGGVFLVDSSS